MPDRAALVTFDDGDRSIYDVALPLLRRWEVPAVAFVVAGLVGSSTSFWWTEVAELVRRGAQLPAPWPRSTDALVRAMKRAPDVDRRRAISDLRASIGSDPLQTGQLTWDECRQLDRQGVRVENHSLTHPCLDRCTDDVVTEEITRAHELLAHHLGRAPCAFAYPNGNEDARARALLADLGYRTGFRFDHWLSRLPAGDALALSRLRVDADAPVHRLETILSGLHPALHRAGGRR